MACIVVTVVALHRPVEFSICMLELRTTFIMEDCSIKILFYNYEMEKISCKLVGLNFEPLDMWNMIQL